MNYYEDLSLGHLDGEVSRSKCNTIIPPISLTHPKQHVKQFWLQIACQIPWAATHPHFTRLEKKSGILFTIRGEPPTM